MGYQENAGHFSIQAQAGEWEQKIALHTNKTTGFRKQRIRNTATKNNKTNIVNANYVYLHYSDCHI